VSAAMDALGAVSFRLPQNQREAVTSQMTAAINAGDADRIDTILRNAAQAAAGTAISNQVIGRDAAINALKDLKQSLVEYEAAGGETNFLTGGIEAIARKAGTTTNPQLAALQTKIRLAVQAYRSAVSGAAFTESELREYNDVFPQINRTFTLNSAVIDSLIPAFEANNSSFYSNFYGDTPSNIAAAATGKPLGGVVSDSALRKEYEEYAKEQSGTTASTGGATSAFPFSGFINSVKGFLFGS